MPQTHISEWSKQTGYPIDRLYATEAREGGTRAVGTGVPGIVREQLKVFTPAEWQQHKSEPAFTSGPNRPGLRRHSEPLVFAP